MNHEKDGITRREFILEAGVLVAGVSGVSWMFGHERPKAETFIAKVDSYGADIASVVRRGLAEIGVHPEEVRGKRILLKPNMVEVRRGAEHINTHPAVIRGAAEAFLSLGAKGVMVGEGAGHSRDSIYVLEESGLAETLREDRIPFVDLNNDSLFILPNRTGLTRLKSLILPVSLKEVDWIVSVAKMKTHHWAGVTLSMKNLFGVMPGAVYGWPKNVLHQNGIERSILDINAAVKPHFAIVDGIIGMEGDGPIMGDPKHAGVLVMGRNLPSVDATSARIMGIEPQRVHYLHVASKWLGPVAENAIIQKGENIAAVRQNFALMDNIAAQKGLRIT
ncbi:DUF362 domain-containing protein [Desulfuromonas sp. TF]|uniref:DUF362 domain-containing protein n=1 Tax=Desulfuromonas sp. TF TaxID=1232410 RepID=UPI00041EC53E|nr:DUF362 domain-containing protein [Desulfuromonas sp. TF]